MTFTPCDQSAKWLYGLEPLKKSQHPTKFGGHRDCGSGEIMVLVCHMISQDHMIKVHVILWVKHVTILQSLVDMATRVVKL